MLVIRAMLLMPAGVPSITLVMGVVLPPQVRVPRMLTVCVVSIFVVALSELLLLSWLLGTVRVWSGLGSDSQPPSCGLVC